MDTSAWTLTAEPLGRVVFRFEGHLDAEEGRASAQALREILGKPRHVVFDVRAMGGYDNAARNAWVATLLPVRRQILSLGVVGGNGIVRMGARALGLGLGIQVRLAASFDALDRGHDEHAA